MLQEAVAYYHDLLSNHSAAAEAHEQLYDGLRQRNLFFGERPLCRVLRPHFYTAEQWNYLKSETEHILGSFARVHRACIEDANLRAQLALEPYEEELFHLDAGFSTPWTTSRLDSFFTVETGRLQFVEYNAETPAGIGYGDELASAFMDLSVMHRFQERYTIHNMAGMGQLLNCLLRGYREHGGTDTPQIGIIDWNDVPTLTEHEICREYFEANGVRAKMADPRSLEHRNGHLWADDFRIDLVYKRVLCSELIDRMGMDNPIVNALRADDVQMSNSFSAKLLAKKASLAVLSDERNAHLFTQEQCGAIGAHIPWTRRVEERKTYFEGKEIDLLPFIAEHRDHLVLKPNDEYGGKGVVIGWETSADDWNETIQTALTEPFVVQDRVEGVYRDFPMMLDDDTLDISPRWVDADPYVFYGETVGGCLTRLSTATLLNVTAGGGSVAPMFVIEKR